MDDSTLHRIAARVARHPDARQFWAGHLPADPALGVGPAVLARLALYRWPATAADVDATADELGIDPAKLRSLWASCK